MMDPQTLINASHIAALPAPPWFIQFFKVLGFTLHTVPMNLWYAGLLVAMLLHFLGGEHGKRFSARLMAQMPVIIAFGINFGIVPLLFTQLAYCKFFYPATILMAWFWLAIIGLLTAAYYGVYVYALGLGEGGSLTWWRKAAGWGAAACFILIGFLFANGISLTDHVDRWPQLWLSHSTAGAALGTALNIGDPTFWPRWLLMFGLALTTTAAWMLVDQAWFAGKETQQYKRWACRTAPKLYTLGLVWFAIAGSWYAFVAWSPELRESMFSGWRLALSVVTAVAPGLPWLLIMAATRGVPGWMATGDRGPAGRGMVSLVALAQFGVLAVNAVSRQVVQNLSLAEFIRWPEQPVREWSPLVVFLILFVAGLGVVGWIIAQTVKASAEPSR
jgi:hypothetical protein